MSRSNLRRDRMNMQQYRAILYLYIAAILSILFFSLYFWVKSEIPDVIKIRAGVAEKFDFGLPVSGTLKRADLSNKEAVEASNIMPIQLNRSLTFMSEKQDSYTMSLKLFGVVPVKSVNVEVISNETLIPAGIPIGIYVETNGVLIIGTGSFRGADGNTYEPSENIIMPGDYIDSVNGRTVNSKADFVTEVNNSDGKDTVFHLRRNGQDFDIKAKPMRSDTGEYKVGVWIRDNAQGIGTLTFVNERGAFGALGHGISDVDVNGLMEIDEGLLYSTEIIGIKKGYPGSPGELTGVIDYNNGQVLGTINKNMNEGIFGTANSALLEEVIGSAAALPIALRKDVHTGAAQIIASAGGEPEYYDIEITELHYNIDNVNRGIVLKITDERLLELTGGIIQGMSGSPIIQDERIVGAVTHVLVQDATKGYGIFIENMVSH